MPKITRGEIWLADLNPIRGSEQAGIRPVIIFQHNILNNYTNTILTIPLTKNVKRANLPTCVLILENTGGLNYNSVALCHQIRVLDKSRLIKKLGELDEEILLRIEQKMLFTMGITK